MLPIAMVLRIHGGCLGIEDVCLRDVAGLLGFASALEEFPSRGLVGANGQRREKA